MAGPLPEGRPVSECEMPNEYNTHSNDWPPFDLTIFPDVHAVRCRVEQHTLESLADTVTVKRKSKNDCELLKLATFGDIRSIHGSLRHDANVVSLTGIEIDYDGEKIPFTDARDKLKSAGVGCVIYTSPSHKVEAPRWRVLAPTSEPISATVRSRLCDLLNGLFNGALAKESWTLSQSYFFGNAVGLHWRCEIIEGIPIDTCEFANITPIPARQSSVHVRPKLNIINGARTTDWISSIQNDDNWHNNSLSLVASKVARGESLEEILLVAPALTRPGYTIAQTEESLREFAESAIRKGFSPQQIDVVHSEKTFSGIELMAMEFTPLVPIVDKLIVPGLTLLCAKPKVGKSWMVLDMGLAVAGGGCALGSLRCEQTEALMLMLEDSKRRLQSRCGTLLSKSYINMPSGVEFQINWPRGQSAIDELKKWLDEHTLTRMVVIDVLQRVKDVSAKNGSIYADDYGALEQYQHIAQERNIAIIILHHLRKADSDDPVDLISGTLGLAGAADHLIVITGNTEAGHKLTLRGRDLPDITWDIQLSGGQWSVIGDTAPKKRTLDAVDRIQRNSRIRELSAGGMTNREIAVVLKKEMGLASLSLATISDVLNATGGSTDHE